MVASLVSKLEAVAGLAIAAILVVCLGVTATLGMEARSLGRDAETISRFQHGIDTLVIARMAEHSATESADEELEMAYMGDSNPRDVDSVDGVLIDRGLGADPFPTIGPRELEEALGAMARSRVALSAQLPMVSRTLVDDGLRSLATPPATTPESQGGTDEVASSVTGFDLAGPLTLGELRLVVAQAVDVAEARASVARRRTSLALVVSMVAAVAVLVALIGYRHRADRLRSRVYAAAFTDDLTGLYNRRTLRRDLTVLEREIRAHRQQGAGVVFLDLDRFKDINEVLGHETGDALLVAVGRRLSLASREADRVMRLGSDEFAILVQNVASDDQMREVAQRVLGAFSAPIRVGTGVEQVDVSVGYAFTDDPDCVHNLLSHADVARCAAKERGGKRSICFHPEMMDREHKVRVLAHALRQADFDEQMRIVYQPIVSLCDDRVVGFEALLRWEDSSLGDVAPAVFIPIAESAGIIPDIGRWVVRSVCEQIEAWNQAGLSQEFTIACNVSPLHLEEDDFVDQISSLLDRYPGARQRLTLEVVESVVLDAGFAIGEKLEQLRTLGVCIAIDDFGSGYSNLGQLPKMPFDTIKVDYSLLASLRALEQSQSHAETGDKGLRLIKTVVSIADVFGAAVVCEGVETAQEREMLRGVGVAYAQGFFTGRPGTPAQTVELLLTGKGP